MTFRRNRPVSWWVYEHIHSHALVARIRGTPIKGGWTAKGSGARGFVLFRKDRTLAPDLTPPRNLELPTVVIWAARKKGPPGLMSTFLLPMHPSERLAKRIGLEKEACSCILLWKGKALPLLLSSLLASRPTGRMGASWTAGPELAATAWSAFWLDRRVQGWQSACGLAWSASGGATIPRTGGRPSQELAGDHPQKWQPVSR